jgi:Holliday junction resolvase RusA-like endonuclease
MNGDGLLDGPLALAVTFHVPRPKGHYGKRGLRPTAQVYPTTRPDVTKLLRAVEDACTGVVWRDDAQVVRQVAAKVYGEPARAEVEVVVIV